MTEDKQKICDFLCSALKETRHQREIRDIEYDERQTLAYVSYTGNLKKIIDVFNCTGVEMIRKILYEI